MELSVNITFEEMTEAYLEEVRAIYNYYVSSSTATFQIRESSPEEMRELVFFTNPKYRTYVIKAAEVVCGYVLLTQFKKREAYDNAAEVTIYLKQGYTGLGIGRYAVEIIEKYAKARSIHTLVASICAENSDSIRLFESCGFFKCAVFKEVGEKFNRRLDVVYYQKIL
jgi:phosphinothricin acetyltransferase